MKNPMEELRIGIFDRLNGSTTYPFYSVIPKEHSYPVGEISTMIGTDNSQKKQPGTSVICDFNVYNAATQSDKEINNMLDEALELITVSNDTNYSPISLTSFSIANQKFDRIFDIPEPNLNVQRKTMRLEFVLTET